MKTSVNLAMHDYSFFEMLNRNQPRCRQVLNLQGETPTYFESIVVTTTTTTMRAGNLSMKILINHGNSLKFCLHRSIYNSVTTVVTTTSKQTNL